MKNAAFCTLTLLLMVCFVIPGCDSGTTPMTPPGQVSKAPASPEKQPAAVSKPAQPTAKPPEAKAPAPKPQAPKAAAPAPPAGLVANPKFVTATSRPDKWKIYFGGKAAVKEDPAQGKVIELVPKATGEAVAIVQAIEIPEALRGKKLRLKVMAQSGDPGKLGVNLYYWVKGERKVIGLNHPGDGTWQELSKSVAFPADLDPKPVELYIGSRPGATQPVVLASADLVPMK